MQRRSVAEALRGFVVIVVGVLTALGLEAGWQGWQESSRADGYLAAIQSEADRNAAAVQSERARSVTLRDSLSVAVARIGRGDIEGDELTIAQHLWSAAIMTGSIPEVSRVVLDDLKSTGNLRLISDIDLRREVEDAYSRMNSQLQRLGLNSDRANSAWLGYLARSGLPDASSEGDARAVGAILRGFRTDPEFTAQVRLETLRLGFVDFYLSNVASVMTELSAEVGGR